MSDQSHADEFADLLDRVSFELSSARAAGIGRPDEVRAALKRARNLVADADALASEADARRRSEGE
jgi:hypothetical protein